MTSKSHLQLNRRNPSTLVPKAPIDQQRDQGPDEVRISVPANFIVDKSLQGIDTHLHRKRPERKGTAAGVRHRSTHRQTGSLASTPCVVVEPSQGVPDDDE